MTGAATRHKEMTLNRGALRNRPMAFIAEPVAGEGRRNSSLVVVVRRRGRWPEQGGMTKL